MRKPSNPFIVSGYHSPDFFCDREKELSWLLDQFKNERNAVLHSWRRMGKTALLKHFVYHLEKKKKAETVFVDLLGTDSLPAASKRLSTAIIRRFGETEKGIGPRLLKLLSSIGAGLTIDPVSGEPKVSFSLQASDSVPASLEAIGNFLMERKKPMVIFIDEFQQVVNYPEENAEATFRSWMQEFPMVRFVFSGSHRDMMMSMFSEEARPFYRSAQLMELMPLPVTDYSAFIIEHFKKGEKEMSRPVLNRIFQWTRLQTYYVQLVCNKLYAKSNVPDEDLLNEVFTEIIQQEIPVFSFYQQLLTSFQWKLLVALSRAEAVENPLSQAFLIEQDLGAASSVATALKTLMKKEFVIMHEGKYTLHDTLLMRWLQAL